MNPVSDARALVAGKFPDTLFAVLGGSVVTHHRIPASGLDIVVVVEGLVITLTSGYAGVVLGVGLLEVVSKALPAAQYFRNPGVELDVALGAVALLAISGTLAGLVPALRAARVDPMVALREGD